MFDKPISRRAFLAASAAAVSLFPLDWQRIAAFAARMGPKSDYSTVIIGAGLGGLCCGAYLAKQGIPVTVVEQSDHPGGYACSFDRAGGKFTFDVSLHGTPIRDNAAARVLQELGVLQSLTLIELPEIYYLKTPDLSISLPQRDPEEYIRRLSEHFPAEKEGIQAFIRKIVQIAEEGDRLHREGMGPELLFPLRYFELYAVLDKTLAQVMNAYVKDPALQNILASLWDFHGLPPSKVSGLYYAAAKGDSLRNGTYYVKHRSSDLSDALVKTIQAAEGQVRFNCAVERILVKDETVSGVQLADGETISARAVVSNANALDTFNRMLPPEIVPKDYLSALKTYRPSLSTFIVWLGLNQDIRQWIEAAGIQVLSRQGPEADYQSCLNGDAAKVPFRISVYDNIYDGYSRPGTSTVRVFCLSAYKPWEQFEADYRAGRKKAYHEEKKKWADILLRRAEEILPGLSSAIESQVAATPLTNWRYTRNPEGAIYGFEQIVDNAYLDRMANKSPVKGLYLAGAWSSPGGGFSGVLVGGQMAFQEMMAAWSASTPADRAQPTGGK